MGSTKYAYVPDSANVGNLLILIVFHAYVPDPKKGLFHLIGAYVPDII